MSVTNRLLIATMLLATSKAVITAAETSDVTTCIGEANARYCLKETTFQDTACCDSTIDCSVDAACTAGCTWAYSQKTMCASQAAIDAPSATVPINNRFMRDALMPADALYCPNGSTNQLTVTATGTAGR